MIKLLLDMPKNTRLATQLNDIIQKSMSHYTSQQVNLNPTDNQKVDKKPKSQVPKKQRKISIEYEYTAPIEDPLVTFKKIEKMRVLHDAPVDTMGCEIQADPQAPIQDQYFQTLIALVISVQTKDETTDKMMSQLKDFGCTAKILSETPPEKIKELIYGSNFNKTKSENINKIANIIMKDYKGKMPTQYGEILAFPGVGHKIAILYFQSTTEESFGIAVDTHVHRISNRLNWVQGKTPEQTRAQLEKLFPKELWPDINLSLVGFGQQICLPRNPRCGLCDLRDICPEYKSLVENKIDLKK